MKTTKPNETNHFPVVADGWHNVCLGNLTMFRIFVWKGYSNGLTVGVERFGIYTFSHYVHQNYCNEKLHVGVGDAGNVADFINDQLGIKAARQGRYEYEK